MWAIFVSITVKNHIIAKQTIANWGLDYWKLIKHYHTIIKADCFEVSHQKMLPKSVSGEIQIFSY